MQKMNIIGVDDQKTIIITLEKMLKEIDPDGHHRFYFDPATITALQDMETVYNPLTLPKHKAILLYLFYIWLCSPLAISDNAEHATVKCLSIR